MLCEGCNFAPAGGEGKLVLAVSPYNKCRAADFPVSRQHRVLPPRDSSAKPNPPSSRIILTSRVRLLHAFISHDSGATNSFLRLLLGGPNSPLCSLNAVATRSGEVPPHSHPFSLGSAPLHHYLARPSRRTATHTAAVAPRPSDPLFNSTAVQPSEVIQSLIAIFFMFENLVLC